MLMNQEAIDRGFESLRARLCEDPELTSEFERSRAEFFPAGAPADAGGDPLSLRRHLEWFLLERESDHLGAVPAEILLERENASPPRVEDIQPFIGSHCGVFEVTGVASGEGLWLRDLSSHGEYAIAEREASQMLRAGDLIVGRLFPVGDSMHHISRAASFYRNPDLLEALRVDLEQARASRRGVLRLSQREIEAMFYAPRAPARGNTHPVGDARRLLLEGGVSREDVDEILAELANEKFESGAILPGAQDILGQVLDRLAFESSIDLERARRALLDAWAELSRSGPGRGASIPVARPTSESPAGSPSLAEAVAAYERRLKSGESLDRALSEIEQALAAAGPAELADEEETPAPDFPGVVGAMIEEFLWEAEREDGAERAQELVCLRSLGGFANAIGVFENLSAKDLAQYTCAFVPESDEFKNADEMRRLLAALQRFCRWSEENHEVRLYSDFKPALRALQESLPRLAEANRRKTRISAADRGEPYELVGIEDESLGRVRGRDGVERDVVIDPELGAWLRSGDRLRGSILSDGRIAVYCCYPREPELRRSSS
jgi:hypothetical protein